MVSGTAVAVTKEGTATSGESDVSAVGAETPIVFGQRASQAVKVAPSRKIGTTIRFKPSFLDEAEGTLVVKSNDPKNPSVEVPLSGIGVAPPDTTAPAAPRDLAALAGDGQVTLTWSPNTEPDHSHYIIYRSTTGGFTPIASDSVGRVDKPDTTFTDTGLANGTTHYYRITAVDNVGNKSGFSTQVSATPTAPVQPVPDISLSTLAHDFGNVRVGTSSDWTLTVSNVGAADLPVTNIVSDNPVFTADRTSFTVAPEGSQKVVVTSVRQQRAQFRGV